MKTTTSIENKFKPSIEEIVIRIIQKVPAYSNSVIGIVDLEPTIHGIKVVFRVNSSIQRYVMTISYLDLHERTKLY